MHFVKAAEFSNTCRSQGIQGSTIDYLVCSVAHLENLIIYTTDKDFRNYILNSEILDTTGDIE